MNWNAKQHLNSVWVSVWLWVWIPGKIWILTAWIRIPDRIWILSWSGSDYELECQEAFESEFEFCLGLIMNLNSRQNLNSVLAWFYIWIPGRIGIWIWILSVSDCEFESQAEICLVLVIHLNSRQNLNRNLNSVWICLWTWIPSRIWFFFFF